VADESDPFRALADPTRRRILDLLLEQGSLTVGELATEFPDLVTSGISKHLMTLRAAGLVVAQKQGRHQRYRIDQDGLTSAFGPWVARYEALWTTALDTLRDLATEHPESH
jgi:DNA-binding transcriptional ArsR family regulator